MSNLFGAGLGNRGNEPVTGKSQFWVHQGIFLLGHGLPLPGGLGRWFRTGLTPLPPLFSDPHPPHRTPTGLPFQAKEPLPGLMPLWGQGPFTPQANLGLYNRGTRSPYHLQLRVWQGALSNTAR